MKLSPNFFALCSLVSSICARGFDVRDVPVVRQGGKLFLAGEPWRPVGGNAYWLGLDENVIPPAGSPFYAPTMASYPTKGRITEAMAIVKSMGGTMLRVHTLGANIGNPLSILPERRKINEEAFETIDWAVYQARKYGLRLMVPLVDNYDYYHGGKFNFLRWAGFNLTFAANAQDPQIMEFYTNPSIRADFKWFIQKLLQHRNRYTGLTYAQDPTIFAFESGNELYGVKGGDMDCPVEWTRDIARYVKRLAPRKLFVDGTYGINPAHLSIREVDIFSDHFYPLNTSRLQKDLDLVASANRPLFVGEYDWTGLNGGPDGVKLQDFYQVLEQSSVHTGDAFWSLFGRNVPHCQQWVNHTDGFTLSYGNPENPANLVENIKLVKQHLTKVTTGTDLGPNAQLPAVACPGRCK